MANARTVALVLAASAALGLAGCTNAGSKAPPSTRALAAPTQVCPEELPRLPEGAKDSWVLATDSPDLPKPSAAWLCKYGVSDPGSGGALETLPWSREGEPHAFPAAGLDAAIDLLDGLAEFPDGLVCTDDLGPRWLVAFQVADEWWGVTVNDYGCREARLTEDPFTVAAGHSGDPRLVRGSLQPPAGTIDALKAAAGLS